MHPYAITSQAAVPRSPAPPIPSPPGSPWGTRWHEQFPNRSYVELAADLAAVPSARYRLRDDLARWQLAVDHGDAELIVTELVTNAVNATRAVAWSGARPPVRLWILSGGDVLFILVWDATLARPVLAAPGDWEESGRGLQFVAAFSDWGHYFPSGGHAGKVVWSQLPKSTG